MQAIVRPVDVVPSAIGRRNVPTYINDFWILDNLFELVRRNSGFFQMQEIARCPYKQVHRHISALHILPNYTNIALQAKL